MIIEVAERGGKAFAARKEVLINAQYLRTAGRLHLIRVSEVSRLKLDNLDWDNVTLVVIGAKSGRPRRYPLTGTVGDAIVRYLREVKPSCTRREVLLAFNAPYRPLTQGAVTAD